MTEGMWYCRTPEMFDLAHLFHTFWIEMNASQHTSSPNSLGQLRRWLYLQQVIAFQGEKTSTEQTNSKKVSKFQAFPFLFSRHFWSEKCTIQQASCLPQKLTAMRECHDCLKPGAHGGSTQCQPSAGSTFNELALLSKTFHRLARDQGKDLWLYAAYFCLQCAVSKWHSIIWTSSFPHKQFPTARLA